VILLPLLLWACTPRPGGDSAGPPDSEPPGSSWGLEAHIDEVVGSLLRLRWEQPQADTVRAGWLDGETWALGPALELEAGMQETVLLGVPFDVQVQVRLEGLGGASEILSVGTGALPGELEHGAVLVGDGVIGAASPPWFLSSSVGMTQGESHSLILDRQGRIVWALASPEGRLTLQPRVARDGGAMLLDHNSFYGSLDGGTGSEVLRLAIDGTEQGRSATPGLHHGFAEAAGGGLAWGATDGGGHDTLELLDVEGSRRSLWDCEPFFASLGVTQACQNNGVATVEGGGFLVSLFGTDSLVELDAEGQVTRWFGQLPGAWDFEPADSAFWFQHGAHYTEAGTLLLSSHRAGMSEQLVVREYQLDAHGERLIQLASFGDGDRLDASLGGSVQRLSSGATLHGTGDAGRIRLFDADGSLAWEAELPDSYLGRVSAIEDLYALLP
jgi:hypothetical protein